MDGSVDWRGMDQSMILRRYDIELENLDLPENIIQKMLPSNPVLRDVARSVTNLRFRDITPAVIHALHSSISPIRIINDGLTKGMEIVSTLYSKHLYHLPEVMMAARIMEIGISLAEKQLPGGREVKGTVVMHAAEGDPHDIGKNIAAVMLRSHGYRVIDLGKDVPISEVVDTVIKTKPLMVSGTALMTTTMMAFPKAAEQLRKNGIEIPYMVAGGAVNREFAESFSTGIYSDRAPNTPPIADRILDGSNWQIIREEWSEITGER